MTLDRMLERAGQSCPDKIAVQTIRRRLTYNELNDQVSALANSLLNLGIGRGDRVAMLLPKSIEAMIAFFAVIRAGGVIAPINMRLKADTLLANFSQLDPFAVIADPLYLPLLQKFFQKSQPKGRIILTEANKNQDYLSFEKLIEKESTSSPELDLNEKDVAYLNYTSGTTGIPKGAITTHGNLFWNTKGAVDLLKLNGEDVHLCMFPIYAHPHEIFCRPVYLSGTIILLDSMYPKTIARAIQEFGVTTVMAVPPFFKSLFPLCKSKEFDFSSLRIPESGGVYSSEEFCREFEDVFGVRFLPVWGSTETTGVALATPPEGEYTIGSLGKPCTGYEVKVLGTGGREVDINETGELVISGPGVVEGYFNLPEETEATFHHGAWYTGDMVRQDELGFYHFLGRRSGLMKVAGLKVYPLEVENALMQHPDVEEAAVISLPDALRGEVPRAFVVPKADAKLEVKELRAFCREQLADYKVPSRIEIHSELPKTETGKVSHAELARVALSELADDEIKSIERRVASVDSKLLELLNARVELMQRVAKLHGKMDQPLYSSLRGDDVIARVIGENKGPIYDEAVEEIFKKILSLDLMINR
ncbi:acid--CoA ligase [candidate division LCP-89 bacterium B3_LCP]|uniref:chorismate mutase n=1 Tax=candidate division LCP-89 bacterium B3_LCP TaxID=2012998 RepID=A0A532V377_UNCL8|nr:MAG: acid--CoA ligase [candidate division LCP-89 bacterium B3_LCP]